MSIKHAFAYVLTTFLGFSLVLMYIKRPYLIKKTSLDEIDETHPAMDYPGWSNTEVIYRTSAKVESLRKALIEMHGHFSQLPKTKFLNNSKAYCKIYDEEGHLPRVFIPRVWSSDSSEGVTLVAQVSSDRKRLRMFENVVKGWPGPVSLTLYINKGEENLLEDIKTVPILLLKPNLDLHLAADNARVYPQNALRQLTLKQVRTEFTFHVDADFIPSKGLYPHLVSLTGQNWPSKKLLVIPAMEYLFEDNKNYQPINKTELLELWRRKKVQSFKQITHRAEHHNTDFAKWIQTNQSYWLEEHQERFEPYFVFRTKKIPPYDERFTGGLNDKVSHMLNLMASGFKLQVDVNYFVIHMPHSRKPPDATRRHFEKCNMYIYTELVAALCKRNAKVMTKMLWQTDVRSADKKRSLSKTCPAPVGELKHRWKTISSITL